MSLFSDIEAAISQSYKEFPALNKPPGECTVDRDGIIALIHMLRTIIFPGYYYENGDAGENRDMILKQTINEALQMLRAQIECACRTCGEPDNDALHITEAFFESIPAVREILASDLEAAYEGDPAAVSRDEIILCYPGYYAITVFRLAHELYKLKVPLIPRIMTEYAHNLTGIDIHPGADIGRNFFIDHGTGIVIGETTEIGKYVKIYQGVTLGALSTRGGQTLRGKKRHPTIEDNVTIYSGASILGGQTVISEGVTVGSNAFITESVTKSKRVTSHSHSENAGLI